MHAVNEIAYWDIVRRSLAIAWNDKFLWFFGFFAAAGGGGNFLNLGERGGESVRDFFVTHLEILVVVVVGLVILWLLFFVMNLISRGALIGCVDLVESGEEIRFEHGWSIGFRALWGMLGLFVTAFAAFLVVTGVCVIVVILPLAAGAPGMAISILIAAVLLLPYLAFLFLLTFTITYAERDYVIHNRGVMNALAAGWELTRRFFGKSIVMWLVSLLSGIVFAMGLVAVLLAASLPFLLIGIANPVVALALGIPVGLVIIILSASAFSTYESALWTLLYRELSGRSAPVSAPVAVGG